MTTTEIDLATTSILDRIGKGVALKALLKDLEPVSRMPTSGQIELAERLPLTTEAEKALATLPQDIKLGLDATPTERRALTAYELAVLASERESLDAVKKAIEARLADQRVAIFNHLDVELESSPDFDPDLYEVDDKGHYIAKAKVPVAGHQRSYVRDVREGSPSVTAESLRTVVDDDEDMDDDTTKFTYQDYLACTTAVRVLDEAKTSLQMRSQPAKMVRALRRAIVKGKSTTAQGFR